MKTWLWRGLLAAAIFLPVLGSAAAQDQQGQDQQGGKDPIEGVWDVILTLVRCDTGAPIVSGRAIGMFGEGGSFTVVPNTFLHSTGVGTSRHLQGQSYTLVQKMLIFNATGGFSGSEVVTAEIQLSTNADEYTDTATFELFDTSDHVISTGCATATARRFE